MTFHTRLRQITLREVAPRISRARARFGKRSRGLPRFSTSRAAPRVSFAAATVEPVWSRLVNSGLAGIENLEAEFGADIQGAARDWAVANYVDDAVASQPSHFVHPSWNFRSAMSFVGSATFPIQTRTLSSTPQSHPILDGGAAYYRLGVAASTTSTMSFVVDGSATPPSNFKLVVIRTK